MCPDVSYVRMGNRVTGVTVTANAKLTLHLMVKKKPEPSIDLHEVGILSIPLELADTVTLKKIPGEEVRVRSDNPNIPTDESSNVKKAIKLMRKYFKKHPISINRGVDVFVHSEVPVSSGLGGSSVDAAAAIVGMNELFNFDLSKEELANIGFELGSDVPLCIYNTPAVVTGFGNEIRLLNGFRIDYPIVLIIQEGRKLMDKTRIVYKLFDLYKDDTRPGYSIPDVPSPEEFLQRGRVNLGMLSNSFEFIPDMTKLVQDEKFIRFSEEYEAVQGFERVYRAACFLDYPITLQNSNDFVRLLDDIKMFLNNNLFRNLCALNLSMQIINHFRRVNISDRKNGHGIIHVGLAGAGPTVYMILDDTKTPLGFVEDEIERSFSKEQLRVIVTRQKS